MTAAVVGGERFTPGPWFVEHTALCGLRVVHGPRDGFGLRDDVPMGREGFSPEAHANLTLAAAAPDLLAALKAMTALPGWEEGEPYAIAARAAIRKATGLPNDATPHASEVEPR